MTTTYADILGAHNVTIPAHLEAQAEIPVLDRLQVQGDVAIIPYADAITVGTSVPPEGIPVVRGENGGNTHLLVAAGPVMWVPVQRRGLDLGIVDVPESSVAYLLHPEHGANALAPGAYLLRRQREQADVIRTVAD